MLKVQKNIYLKNFTTFKIGGAARYFVVIKSERDLCDAFLFAKSHKLRTLILGGGSNVLIPDQGFSGLVIKNEIKGIKFIEKPTEGVFSDKDVVLEVGAGETLDKLIRISASKKLSGFEKMSGIPGTVGGAVVQNAGAYGAEIKDLTISVECIRISDGKKFILTKANCRYGYRTSFFKKNKKFIIISVRLLLSKRTPSLPERADLASLLIYKKSPSSTDIRKVVLKVREKILPNLEKFGCAGSFYLNPTVTEKKHKSLRKKFNDLPGYHESKGKIKIPLAWVLDKICGLKGFREGQVGLHEQQPLIIVNFGGASQKEILQFAKKIKKIVKLKTGIKIKEEIEEIKKS